METTNKYNSQILKQLRRNYCIPHPVYVIYIYKQSGTEEK